MWLSLFFFLLKNSCPLVVNTHINITSAFSAPLRFSLYYLSISFLPVIALAATGGSIDAELAYGQQSALTRGLLEQSLELGTRFLLNNQREPGNFTYEYDFVKKRFNPSDNQVRQAGALWGLALINQFEPSGEVEAALIKGLNFFREHSRDTADGGKFIVYPGARKGATGTVALTTLSLIEFLNSSSVQSNDLRDFYHKELDAYIRFLLSLRLENGQFFSTYSLSTGKGIDKPSPYYDGESLLALVKAAKYAGYTDLEQTIKSSAQSMYEINIVHALAEDPDSNTTKGFFQWGSMAFYELYTSGWEDTEKYGGRIIDLSHWMIDVHRTLRRTKNTGYAYEGIIHAWETARLAKDLTSARKFSRVIDEGLSKLTTWQVGHPTQNVYLAQHTTNDPYAVGGVLNHRSEPYLRIDVTQHQMHAVILGLKYLNIPD